MTDHKIGTREEWLAARLELLKAEKALTRSSDELAQRRQRLPWVRIDKEYRFETDEGMASLADLFRGHSQLLIYHFMFGPEYTGGCPACSAIADGFNGFAVHLEHHDVAMIAVSRAPIAALQVYKRRMGWTFTWASSLNSDFNYDFNTSFTEEQQFVTYGGLFFRSMRFGIDEAHGRGTAVQWNWLREKGAITPNPDGTFKIDVAKSRDAVGTLATELLTIQATGDYPRAQRLLAKYGVSNPEIEGVIGKMKDIPVDITPVFAAAGEK